MYQGGSGNSHPSIFWSTEKEGGKFISLFPLLQLGFLGYFLQASQLLLTECEFGSSWAMLGVDGMVKSVTQRGESKHGMTKGKNKARSSAY